MLSMTLRSTRSVFGSRKSKISSNIKFSGRRRERENQSTMMKQQLSQEIWRSGPLSSSEEVTAQLSTLGTTSSKVTAVKSQIKFRPFVLHQKAEKTPFQWSSTGKPFSWEKRAQKLTSPHGGCFRGEFPLLLLSLLQPVRVDLCTFCLFSSSAFQKKKKKKEEEEREKNHYTEFALFEHLSSLQWTVYSQGHFIHVCHPLNIKIE